MVAMFRRKNLELDVPLAVINHTTSLANIGKSVDDVIDTLVGVQADNVLDLDITFVRASSMSKPFLANVMGS